MELLIAVTCFGAFAGVSILAFTHFNRFASNARYMTLAAAVAQERIDEIMTVPCTVNSTQTGSILYLSGTTVTVTSSGTLVETNLPLNNDVYNVSTGTIGLSGSTVQTNTPLTTALMSTSSGTTYAGSLDTQVIDSRTTYLAPVSGNYRLISGTVVVAYTYRGTQYTIPMYFMRATDNF